MSCCVRARASIYFKSRPKATAVTPADLLQLSFKRKDEQKEGREIKYEEAERDNN